MIFVANGAFAQKGLAPGATISPAGLWQPLVLKAEKRSVNQVPANWSARNMGVVCRYEWKQESGWRLPLRVRLGSLSYCNWLEQKPNAGKAVPLP